jgi:CHAT domain-containing protein
MRGFLYAGTSSMLLSLWRVFDISTALFMKQFYQQIILGKSLAESWQHALLATKERWPHPYYWGPFLLIGKPDTTKTLSHNV